MGRTMTYERCQLCKKHLRKNNYSHLCSTCGSIPLAKALRIGKVKITLSILTMFMLFILSSPNASANQGFTNFTAAQSINTQVNTATAGMESGWKVMFNVPRVAWTLYLNSTSGGQANRAFIRNQSGNVIANVTITNNRANFNGVPISAGLNYTITVTNTSGTWNVPRSSGSSTFPYNATADFNITRSIDNGGAEQSGAQSWWVIRLFEYGTPIDITLNSPLNNSRIINRIFNATVQSYFANLTNATIFIWNANNDTIINQTTISLTGTPTNYSIFNISSLPIGSYKWNVLGCIQSGNCAFQDYNQTFVYGNIENSISYNSSSYVTASETFTLNITPTSGISSLSATFFYAGTSHGSSSKTSIGNDVIFTSTIDVPSNGTNNFYWQLNMDSSTINSTISNQSVANINLTLCSAAPQNVPYINFTFKNETTAAPYVNASIASSIFSYWLGSGSIIQTLSYSSVTELSNYTFCFSPTNRTINANATISYTNSESPQRTAIFSSLSLTNTSQNVILYLLPSSSGTYTRYRTVNVAGTTIPNVLAQVSRVIGGSSAVIASGYTDDSGLVSFFLNPDLSYDYVFSKTGFASATFSLIPNSLETYTVTMGGSSSGLSGGTTIANNLTYLIEPTNSSLLNNTLYSFAFNVTSSQTITFISLNITNASGYQLGYTSNAGQGYISVNVNTGNYSALYGYGLIQTANESFTPTRVWTVSNDFAGDYSLYRQSLLFSQYQFSPIIRLLLFCIIVIGITIYVSQTEFVENTDGKIAVIIILVWAFSFVGWLDLGLTINTTTQAGRLASLGSKYGIAILTTAAGGGLVLRRMYS